MRSVDRIAQLRREARAHGEIYRTPAEQRRKDSHVRCSARVLPGVHYDVATGELHSCPACGTSLVLLDPAGPTGRWICMACPWYGRVPRPQE